MVALARSHVLQPQVADKVEFAADVVAGLGAAPKRLPAKYFYDATGSHLFERITELPEYYPTRTEMTILRDQAADIAKLIAPGAALVEFGSGSSKKARIMLAAAPELACYVPVDICGEMIEQEAIELRADFPNLKVLPVTADICYPFELPEEAKAAPVRVGFFPGSTIGNFEPHEAASFLRNAAQILGPGATLIIGADLIKSADILNAAYNDKAGVTAKFNLNLLTRINRELRGTFNLETFEHHAFYNRERNRIEMHLASLKRQKVKVAGECFDFRAGETIHTENSYKYDLGQFRQQRDSLDWSDFQWLREIWPHKFFIKGVLHAEDARMAVQYGADGVFVSNHGGRQLDGAQATIDVLPEIRAAVGKDKLVMLDGGIRRGSDVVKAIALGADMAFAGRAPLYGVAAGGEAGALHAIQLLKSEVDRVLALLGCPDINELGPQFLARMASSAHAQ